MLRHYLRHTYAIIMPMDAIIAIDTLRLLSPPLLRRHATCLPPLSLIALSKNNIIYTLHYHCHFAFSPFITIVTPLIYWLITSLRLLLIRITSRRPSRHATLLTTTIAHATPPLILLLRHFSLETLLCRHAFIFFSHAIIASTLLREFSLLPPLRWRADYLRFSYYMRW